MPPHPRTPLRDAPVPGWLGRALSPAELAEVERLQPMIRPLRAGDSLYQQGDDGAYITFLMDGWAFREQYLSDGRRQILEFSLPGTVFGFAAEGQTSHGVTLLTGALVSQFSRLAFYELMQRLPCLAVTMVTHLAYRRSLAYEHLTTIGQRTARERVAHLLCELFVLGRDHAPLGADGSMFMPITQPQIGDALGLSAVHVNRMLMALRRDHIAELRERRLRVFDLPCLAEEGGFDLEAASQWNAATLRAA